MLCYVTLTAGNEDDGGEHYSGEYQWRGQRTGAAVSDEGGQDEQVGGQFHGARDEEVQVVVAAETRDAQSQTVEHETAHEPTHPRTHTARVTSY